MSAAEATWEPVDSFHVVNPPLQFEDELLVVGGEMLWSAGGPMAEEVSQAATCGSVIARSCQ